MKDRSREKIAELMMDELLSQLSERGNIRKLLGEMTGLPIGPLVEDLIREFEQVVEEYHGRSLSATVPVEKKVQVVEAERYTPTELPSTPLPVQPSPPEETPSKPILDLQVPEIFATEPPAPVQDPPVQEEKAPIVEVSQNGHDELKEEPQLQEVIAPPPDVAVKLDEKEPGTDVTDFRSRLEELARRVENEYLEKLEKKPAKKKVPAQPPPEAEDMPAPPPERSRKKETIEVGFGEGGRPSRIPFRIDDQEYMYVHGVMAVPPTERPCEHPFMLEEKGIDGKEFAFAVDVEDLRFFLSKVNQKDMNVSRKGVLLLGKSESIQLNGLHESILNELRAHGIVLPMEFGTVARGKADFLALATQIHANIRDDIARLTKTSWWTLNMSVLDGRIAQLFADELGGKPERDGRQRERVSYSAGSLQAKKFDVKLLEKILQKEKRLAESVHQELGSLAERSEIQSMVGLGSGSSDDWKQILRASYLVTGNIGYQRFTRAVTDLQYRHILFEPMLSITGDAEDFSFLKK